METSTSIELEEDRTSIETTVQAEGNSRFNHFLEAVKDYVDGFKNWKMWSYMVVADLRRRYRRTVIGPFWTTLSLAIFITSMGVLFSLLWKTNIKAFLPYFASGFVCWTFVSTNITDGCFTFIAQEGLLKQIAFPLSSCSYLVVGRNFLVFLHQVVIYIVIAIIFRVSVTPYTLLIIPGFLLLCFSCSWLATLLGLFCARFRDVQQVVISLLQISMFVTPIFWPEKQLGTGFKAYLLINGNPLYHYVAVIREPLLGKPPHLISWIVVALVTLIGWFVTMWMMAKHQRKLIFWL